MQVNLTSSEGKMVISCLSSYVNFSDEFEMATRARLRAIKNITDREEIVMSFSIGECSLIRNAIIESMGRAPNETLQKNFKNIFDKFVYF